MKPYILVMTHTKMDYDSRIKRQLRSLYDRYSILLFCKKGNMPLEGMIPKDIICFEYDPIVNYVGSLVLDLLLSQNKVDSISEECIACNTMDLKCKNSLYDGSYLMTTKQKLQNDFAKVLTNALLEEYSSGFTNLSVEECYYTYQVGMFHKAMELTTYIAESGINVFAIISNDVFIMPLANWLRKHLNSNKNIPYLIADLHEIHFNYCTDRNSLNQRIRTWACDEYIPLCKLGISVSDYGKNLYVSRYPMIRFISIQNVSDYKDLPLKKYKKNKGKRLVYVGVADSDRAVDQTITCLSLLDQTYTLTMYLVAQTQKEITYKNQLQQMIRRLNLQKRVHIKKPVRENELIEILCQYDIGIFYLKPIRANHQYALPNKLFEYIQARLAVVMTPLTSIEKIIDQYQIGKVSSDFTVDSFVEAIKEVSKGIIKYKEQANLAAKVLNSELEWQKLIDELTQLEKCNDKDEGVNI